MKKQLEELGKDWKQFRADNDARLEKLEKSGGSTSDYDEKLQKINDELDKKEKRIDELKLAIQRTSADGKAQTAADLINVSKDAKKVMQKLMKKGSITPDEEAKLFESYGEEYKTLSVQIDEDGGFFVRPEVSTRMSKKIFESSPVRQLATVETISSDSLEIHADYDEPDAGWVGETQARAVTNNSQIKLIVIPVHEQHASPKATQKLLDDAGMDIEAWHQGKVVMKFAREEATAFVNGDGVLRPRGFLQYPSGTDFGQVQQVVSGSAGLFTDDGLHDLQTALKEAYQMNASWLMKRASAGEVRKLKDGDGRYLFSLGNGGLNSDQSFTLLGKPLRYADDMPAIAADALAAAYGDFREGYTIVDRIGIRVLRDPYTSKGSIIFYTTKRVGGAVYNFEAIKLQKLAT